MDNNRIKLTPEQEASIEHRGSSLLVSAAAGSGKTKVLVERLLKYVEDGAEIDEFLVITYTRAAAYELREKIYEELLTRLALSPGNVRLRRQAMLCRGASIDTIHSICGEILRENSHLVKLPPDFRIADEAECRILMNDVAESVIEGFYEQVKQGDGSSASHATFAGFKLLIDTVTDGRDDRQLIELVMDLYNKLRSLPDPKSWIEQQINCQGQSGISDISQTDSGAYMLNKMRFTVSYIHSEIMRLRNEMRSYPDFENKYADSVKELNDVILEFKSALELGWDAARAKSLFQFSKAKSISGYEELKEIRTKCIKELRKCAEILESSSEDHIKEAVALSPAITTLMQVLLVFDETYSEEKRRRGLADFSDLEHLTLSLLIDSDTGERTGLALSLSQKFREILIDEYQDVNAVQELIFNAVSKNSTNIFMVGDLKQSIYRFRQADPSIFLSKYKSFSEYKAIDGDGDAGECSLSTENGRKIYLSRNFRSHAGILETVNHIFSNIMSVDFGELDYTEKEWLVPGRTTGTNEKGIQGIPYHERSIEDIADNDIDNLKNMPTVDVAILDMSKLETEPDEENPAAIKIEAEYIASEIKRLTNGKYFIPDGDGGERPIKESDIVILLRSIKGRAWQFTAALSDLGISSEQPGGEGFFDSIELKAIIALLTVIDNPMQDIPLAAALTGPVYNFTSDELAEIRFENRGESYYTALQNTAEHNTGSSETPLKCRKVLGEIDALRAVNTDMSADRFIWHVYNKTGLLDLVASIKGGKKRRQNLILFAECARIFEKNGYRGLFGFLNYIRSLQERGEELHVSSDDKMSGADSSDSVKIMSVHKSKGLEFPVVFLANTAKQYNYIDMRKSVVFHSDLGVGTMFVNKKLRTKHSTLARDAIRSKLTDEMLSEELRVLYVAMTRAKEKLILTAAFKDADRKLTGIDSLPPGKISPQELMLMRSTAEWILAGVRGINSKEVTVRQVEAFQTAGDETCDSIDGETSLLSEHQSAPPCRQHSLYTDKSDDELLNEDSIEREHDSEFVYPYISAIGLPSKLTVTGLTKLFDAESEPASWVKDGSEIYTDRPLPAFLTKKKEISGAERGTLLHLVMQHIDYKTGSGDDGISKELQRMVNEGVITSEQIIEINKEQIKQFLKSGLGGRMNSSNNLTREFKFSILVPAEKYFPGGGDDKILMQGIIDCFFEEDGELVVVDFKSDKVTDSNINEKAARYAPQLDAYAYALNRITGKKVKEKIIYFFELGKACFVKTPSTGYQPLHRFL